jgi:hypothetical protein
MSQYPLNRLLLLAFGSSVLFIGNILPQIYGQTLNNSSLGIQEGISSGDITDHSANMVKSKSAIYYAYQI